MAGRATYSDADKARVYVVLTANDGNVKRTSREAGVPENTVRRWRDEWEKNGPPATEEVEQAVSEFTTQATTVRDLAVDVMEKKLKLLQQDPDKAKLAELSTVVGVLDDKIRRASGLDEGNRVDHHHHLPAADEIRELMTGFVQGAIAAAERRTLEIVDAEFEEQPALPSGS